MLQKVSLIMLGCPKNLVDSEIILGYLARSNYSITTDWRTAGVCIINTCAFLNSAVKEAEQWIQKAISYKNKRQIKKVIVAGCLPQRYKDSLLNRFPAIDGIIGIDELADISKAIANRKKFVKVSDVPSCLFNYQTPRLLSTNHYAYLKIADGCSNFCSYCLIPSIRGKFRSRKIADIVKEARHLCQNGIKEIILIAQDTTLYGKDIYKKLSLARLLKNLVKIKDIKWLRVLYTHPAHWTNDLIETFQDNPQICRYVDLPLQHISDNMLRMMNRPYNRKQVEQLLLKLRKIPNLAIRTSFIVGFPNETERDFEELLNFVKEQKFAHLGCFKYSREPGTLAYNLPNQIPERIKKARFDAIMTVQQQISYQRMKSFIGKKIKVIVDDQLSQWESEIQGGAMSNINFIGRTEYDAPEIDGVVYIKASNSVEGDIIEVNVRGAQPYALIAEQVK
ncbi:MAG: 30S ribosomal protein S12 methylthiotransferase RimO [candidate division WOR-3 bacterium]|nr:30S ribosomal protein S12 methylthiotransferase RimO [candidate division WOR-3 bacterium]